VIATAAADATDQVRALGAAETVDHHRPAPAPDQVRQSHPDGVDALIDLISDAPSFAALAELVRPGGTAATTVFVADPDALARRGVRGLNLNAAATVERLDRLRAELDAGRLTVPIEAEIPLAEAPAAIPRLRAGGARGKTVILIWPGGP